MNVIRNKLRAKDGASIFMGLMFLLVCLMVGAVVLAAATAAAGKLAELRETEQDYLNVASAARMMKDTICDLTYTHKETTVTTYDNEGNASTSGPALTVNTLLNSKNNESAVLGDELKNLCNSVISAESTPAAGTAADPEKSFKITGPAEQKWKDVYGKLRMKTDGRIIIELWLGVEDKANEENHNFMQVEFSPEGPLKKTEVYIEDLTGGGTKETVTVTTTCSWPKDGCTITKGKQ